MLQNLTRYRRHRGRIFVILVCGFFLLFTPGCSDETDKKVATVDAVPVPVPEQEKSAQKIFQSISAVDAEAMLKTREGVLLIDVRTPQEIKQMKIAGSLAIPVGDVIRGKFVPPEGTPVMLVCAIGGRSYIAGKALASMGYREVYNLDGGIEAWRRAGLPLEH
jgi:rhodanese-related sulfurtransferase